jgi:hypothetical protein
MVGRPRPSAFSRKWSPYAKPDAGSDRWNIARWTILFIYEFLVLPSHVPNTGRDSITSFKSVILA